MQITRQRKTQDIDLAVVRRWAEEIRERTSGPATLSSLFGAMSESDVLAVQTEPSAASTRRVLPTEIPSMGVEAQQESRWY